MIIDFTPVHRGELRLGEYAERFTVADLRDTTEASIDRLARIIAAVEDAAIVFIPDDPDANDPYAAPEEMYVGWSLGHLVAHVTATSEESAAIASILARGIPYPRQPRLRYETPWRDIRTRAQALNRLEESRRIRLAYLSAFPDVPHLDAQRELSDWARERYGYLNAIGQLMSGLSHEAGHVAQFEEAARQAREAAGQPE